MTWSDWWVIYSLAAEAQPSARLDGDTQCLDGCDEPAPPSDGDHEGADPGTSDVAG
jgi:hypothetical protein